MKKLTKDLFDDTTMTFGEHLEILRIHLFKAVIGLVIAMTVCLYFGTTIVDIIRRPIDRALKQYAEYGASQEGQEKKTGWERFVTSINLAIFGVDGELPEGDDAAKDVPQITPREPPAPNSVIVEVPVEELARALHRVDPERFPLPPAPPANDAAAKLQHPNGPARAPDSVTLTLTAPEFGQFQTAVRQLQEPVTLNVQEAFMVYVKVSMLAGLIVSSPWIFFQLWLFVAAGLYPHEQKYVYVYGSMSLVLFLVGAVFCYFAVFPFVLNFLLGMNAQLKIHPQIRLSEWISFALLLPLAFGISFELPLVMLFLERISIFEVKQYQEQRRLAILVIAILSAVLTPAEPMSMLLMMFPLIGLYELGIVLCKRLPKESPFEAGMA